MKKIFLTVFAMLSMGVFAQKNAMSTYFSEYQTREDFTQVQLTGKVFEMIAALEGGDEDLKEAQKLFENIRGISMVITESADDGYGMYRDAIKKLNGFELLMNVKEKDSDFSIMIDEHNGTIDELVMIGGGENSFAIVDIYGEIDLNRLSKVMSYVKDQQGSLHLDSDMLDRVEVYPNPVRSGSAFHIKVSEDMVDGTCKLYDAKGSMVWEGTLNGTETKCQVRKLRSGIYAAEIEHDGVLIRKKIMVQ